MERTSDAISDVTTSSLLLELKFQPRYREHKLVQSWLLDQVSQHVSIICKGRLSHASSTCAYRMRTRGCLILSHGNEMYIEFRYNLKTCNIKQ